MHTQTQNVGKKTMKQHNKQCKIVIWSYKNKKKKKKKNLYNQGKKEKKTQRRMVIVHSSH